MAVESNIQAIYKSGAAIYNVICKNSMVYQNVPEADVLSNKVCKPVLADILIVMDNSGSMAAKQKLASEQVEQFIAPLKAAYIDYHIAVITTDDPNFFGSPAVLTSKELNGLDSLKANLKVGTTGDSTEVFLIKLIRLFHQLCWPETTKISTEPTPRSRSSLLPTPMIRARHTTPSTQNWSVSKATLKKSPRTVCS